MRILIYLVCAVIGGAAAVALLNCLMIPPDWHGGWGGFAQGAIFGAGVSIGLVAAHVLLKTSKPSEWES